MLQNNKIIIVV